jgi:hypothetical protein
VRARETVAGAGCEGTTVKLSNLVYAAVGYTLGARAGRERYEDIVRVARRVSGSQTVQATAGVVQARVDQLTRQARNTFGATLQGQAGSRHSANGHRTTR